MLPLNMTCSLPSAGADEQPVSNDPKVKTSAVKAVNNAVILRMFCVVICCVLLANTRGRAPRIPETPTLGAGFPYSVSSTTMHCGPI